MDWIAAIEREGHALSTAARHDFKAAVPACPGWDVDDLLRHIALLHHRNANIIRTGRTTPPSTDDGSIPQPPSGNLLGWYEAGLADLLDAARTTPVTTTTWSFSGPVTVEWWLRRMAHETTVHRVDAEQATGIAGPIEAAFAADGLDEAFTVLVTARHAGQRTGDGETVHVHTTDTEGEWLLTLTGDGVRVERGHLKGDLAVRGPAADLLLWIWGRRDAEGLEQFGDLTLVDRFRQLTTV